MPTKEICPIRPDGGSWIAVGNRYPQDFNWMNFRFAKYCYGGERRAYWENFLDLKSIDLRVYDTQPDLNKYMNGPVEIQDDNLCKLLYIIKQEIPMAVIRQAIAKGDFLQGIDYPTPPMVLVLDK